MRRILLIVVAALAVWFVGGKLRYAFASPETQIRWRLEEMVEGFNTTVLRKLTDGIRKDYRDEGGYGKTEVADAARYVFLNKVDPKTKAFMLSLELVDEDLSIEVEDTEPLSAWARVHFRFTEKKDGTERIYWDARFSARMEDGDNGWQITRTKDVDHAERPSVAGR